MGFFLAFGAWLIINTIMDTLAAKNIFYGGAWSDPTKLCEMSPFRTDYKGTPVTPVGELGPGDLTKPAPQPGNLTKVDASLPLKATNACSSNVCQIDEEMNTKLVSLNNAIKADGKTGFWEITEAWPPTVQHENICHDSGTCIDAALRGPNRAGVGDINYFEQKAAAAGLNAVYEVPNDARKQQLINAGYKGRILTVPGINGEHFSVYKL
jgi:hypothetical protein